MASRNGNLQEFRLSLEQLPLFVAVAQISLLLWSAFKIVYLAIPANAIISNPASDKPYIRPEAFAEPRRVGIHYFGDFLQTFDWATLPNPWTYDPEFLAQYPPVAVYALKILTPFPYFTALTLYLSLMIIGSAWIIWQLMPSFTRASRLAASITLGIGSSSALMAFDRGNSVGFLSLLFGLFAIGVVKEKKNLAVMAFVLMATTKIYPLLLVFVFIKKRWWREIAIALAVGLALTAGLLAITPGDFLETFKAFLAANTGSDSYWKYTLSLGVDAFIDVLGINAQLLGAGFSETVVTVWTLTRYGLIALLAILIFLPRNSNIHETLLLSGFSMMVFYTAPHNYAWTWSLPMIALILDRARSKFGESATIRELLADSKILTISMFGLLMVALPIPVAVPGTQKSVLPFLGYFVIMCSVIFGFFGAAKAKAESPQI